MPDTLSGAGNEATNKTEIPSLGGAHTLVWRRAVNKQIDDALAGSGKCSEEEGGSQDKGMDPGPNHQFSGQGKCLGCSEGECVFVACGGEYSQQV